MTSQAPRRERSSSDKAQAIFVPQRPGLPGRTISAPAGGLHKLDSSRMATETGNKIEPSVIEEEEIMTSHGKNEVPSTRAGDEVQLKLSVLQDPRKRIVLTMMVCADIVEAKLSTRHHCCRWPRPGR